MSRRCEKTAHKEKSALRSRKQHAIFLEFIERPRGPDPWTGLGQVARWHRGRENRVEVLRDKYSALEPEYSVYIVCSERRELRCRTAFYHVALNSCKGTPRDSAHRVHDRTSRDRCANLRFSYICTTVGDQNPSSQKPLYSSVLRRLRHISHGHISRSSSSTLRARCRGDLSATWHRGGNGVVHGWRA